MCPILGVSAWARTGRGRTRSIQMARGPWRIRTRTWSERRYDASSRGDLDALRQTWNPNIVWHVAGRSPLAGDYEGVDAVLGFFGKLIELSGGTFQVQLHDVMANDMHVASLHTNRAERNGRRLDLRVVLISHVRDGKIVEVWNFVEDQYAAAEFWS